jgi:cytochrome b561
MHLCNGPHGYGLVTKVLHWAVVLLVAAQFAVGLTMESELRSAADRAEERFERGLERREEAAKARGKAAEDRFDERADRLRDRFESRRDARDADEEGRASVLHLVLGSALLGLGLARLLWRRTTPLPPWAEHLSRGERTLESWLEKALLTLLLLVPLSGLLLLATGPDLLAVHVAAQIALVTVIAVHVGLVLSHTVIRRHRHLARML